MAERLSYDVTRKGKGKEKGGPFLKPRVIFLLSSVSEHSPVISANAFFLN
jgi:hypothetical protein